MFKIKHFIRQSWLLMVSAFCFGLLIAAANTALAPKIEQNKIGKISELMKKLLPQAVKFKIEDEIDVSSKKDINKKTKSKIYKALSDTGECVGWSFNCQGPGFADKIELIVAVNENFTTIAGFDCLASNETPGFGDQIKKDYYRNQFIAAPAEILTISKTGEPEKIDAEIVAISGATISSVAVVDIINNAMTQIKKQVIEKGLIGNGK